MLGSAIYRAFKKTDHSIVGLAHSRKAEELVQLDLTDKDAVSKFLREHTPDCKYSIFSVARVSHKFLTGVIHCAAERRPDVAEKVSPWPGQ